MLLSATHSSPEAGRAAERCRYPAYEKQSEAAPEWYRCCFTTLARKGRPSQCSFTASASSAPASGGSSRWRSDMVKPAKNTICLWYDGDAEDAARFYARTFPDSSVGAVHRAPGDFPSGKKGDVLTVEFTVMGLPCLGLNGGPAFKHNEAFSF